MRIGLIVVVVGLLACKQSKDDTATKPAASARPVSPGLSPSGIFDYAKKDPELFEAHPMRVTGTVIEVRPGGTEIGAYVDLDAGKGRKVVAGMGGYHCLRGTCFREPPKLGATVTMDCEKAALVKLLDGKPHPVLRGCEVKQ